MKRMVCVLSVLVLLFSSALALTVHAATEPENIDYKALFNQSATIGHDSSSYVRTLKAAYEQNPALFWDELSECSEDTISLVIFDLTEGNSLDELYAMRDFVIDANQNSRYNYILSALNEQIGILEYIDIMEPYMQYENPDAPFSIPLLMRFIDLNIENYTLDHDEGFNQMLASAYEASPVIVAEILCDYSDQEVNNLAKCIAADYKKYSRSIPSPSYDEQPEDIASIIRTIQHEIHNAVNTQPSNDESTGNGSTEITDNHSIVPITALACMFSLVLIAIILKKQETH